MRIPSGSTDRQLPFIAMDSVSGLRKTGLSSFTVYRSRNGGTATVMTTPTIAEASAANMPGLYWLLVDEDTTIDSAHDEEEIVFYITATNMKPEYISAELFRPKATEGQTLTVAAGTVTLTDGSLTAAKIGADAITAAKIAADVTTEVQAGLATATNLADVKTDTNSILGRLPNSLVSGRIDASVGAMAVNTITSSVIALDAITANGIAANAIGASELATDAVTEIQTNLATTLSDIQSRLPAALAGGRMDANVGAMAANTVTASAVATDAVTEIQNGLATSAALITLQADTDDIQSRLPAALVGGLMAADAVGISGSTTTADNVEAKIGNLDVAVSTRLATAGYTAPDNASIAAIGVLATGIKGKTDNLPPDPADASDIAAGFSTVVGNQTTLNGNVLAVKGKTDNLPSDPADASDIATRFTTVDTSLSTLQTTATAIKGKTDNLPATPAAVSNIPTAVQNAQAILREPLDPSENLLGSKSLGQFLALVFNVVTLVGNLITVKKTDGTTTLYTQAVTRTAGATPVTGHGEPT